MKMATVGPEPRRVGTAVLIPNDCSQLFGFWGRATLSAEALTHIERRLEMRLTEDKIDLDFRGWTMTAERGDYPPTTWMIQVEFLVSDSAIHGEGGEPTLRITGESPSSEGFDAVSILIPVTTALQGRVNNEFVRVDADGMVLELHAPTSDAKGITA